jgi:hypothetical protein
MISEVLESTDVIRTINKHLSEENCIHNIREIMQEALENIVLVDFEHEFS